MKKTLVLSKTMLMIFLMLIFLASILTLTGCMGMSKAIQNSEMSTKVKMSDTIFLDAATLEAGRNVYVRITNTSEMSELKLDEAVKSALHNKGFKIVKNPVTANHILQANLLYMDFARDKSMTAETMILGGFGGAVAGSAIGGSDRANIAGGIAGAVVGGVLGAALGNLYSVDTFLGLVDIQIQEKVAGEVKGKAKTKLTQGSASTMETQREIKTDYETYRTRIAVEVTQTNIKKEEAAKIIEDKLVKQISGMF